MSRAMTADEKAIAVVRESALAAKPLLEILFTTLAREVPQDIRLPDIDSVIDVYDDPTSHGAQTFPLTEGKAVVVEGDQCDVLLSLSTARKLNDDGNNDFVEVLAGVLETGTYSAVVTTSFSRLCRNTVAASRLQRVLQERRIPLLIGRQCFNVWEPTHQMLWLMYAWFAEYEAQTIEARLLAGKISRLQAGEWCLGFAPPPGWTTDSKRIVLDPDVADAVRFAIGRICDGETNFSELARKVSQRWPAIPARKGSGRWNKAESGTAIARSWLNERWFPAYVDNQVELEFIPHSVKQAIKRGVEVDPSDIVRVKADLPPQPAPIATPEQIEQVRQLLASRSQLHGSRVPPGTVFGSGIAHPVEEVEIVEVGA